MHSTRYPVLLVRLFAILLVGLAISPDAQAAASAGEVLFESGFSAQELNWDVTEGGFVRPVLPETRYSVDPGLMDLPIRELTLLIPLDAVVRGVVVEPLAVHFERVPGSLAVAGPMLTDSGDAVFADPQKSSLPAQVTSWGEYSGTHIWRGHRLLTVTVSPLRVATEGDVTTLEFLDSFAVRVELESGADVSGVAQRQRRVPREESQIRETLSKLAANSHAVGTYARQTGADVAEPVEGFQPTAAPSLAGSAVSFLIITDEEMAPEFQRLADFKTAIGMPTSVVTTQFIEAYSRNGADLQDTIRMFTRDAYELWGTEYLLLGGDTDIIPARYVDNSFFPTIGSTLIPVDLYFAGLDGNWNDNGNARYGEPYTTYAGDDFADFAEEVYLGRATVSTLADAAVFVDKVIGYESAGSDADWANRALFAAEVLFPVEYPVLPATMEGAEFSEEIIDSLLTVCTDMEYTRMYEAEFPYVMEAPLTVASLIDTLNTGRYGIFNQIGHGFYFNMSVGDGNFMTGDADNLRNGDHLFLMYSLNCASAAFDYSCLMERLVQNPNGGSIASIGASRAAFPTTSNSYQQQFFDHLFCQEDNRLGRLIALSRLPFLANTYLNRVDRWTFQNYTLLGDPTVRIWTSTPNTVVLDTPTSMDLGPNTVAITVSDTLGVFVPGVSVCLTKAGDDVASGVTDALGQVNLDFLATSPGTVDVMISGQNMAITSAVIPVVAADTYLALSDMQIVDDGLDGSSGNGNSVAEAGEVVALWPTLTETGGGGAAGLVGTLSTTVPGVTIINDTVDFGNVAAGGSTNATTPFLVSFPASMDDGTRIDFQITVFDVAAGTYLSEWNCQVLAPEIYFSGVEWADTVYGNGDGFIDGYERLNLSVSLKNFGAGMADELTLKLRTSDGNVVLYADTLATITNLGIGEEVSLNDVFSMSLANITKGRICWIIVEDGHGETWRQYIRIDRPLASENLALDSSLGPDIIALRWNISDSGSRYGYNVYRSLEEGGPFTRINTDIIVNTTYYVDVGLEQLTKYYYKVATIDTSRISSDLSDVAGQSTAPEEVEGFPTLFTSETSGPLAVGDVDGKPGLEIVLGSNEVYVWHYDGSELLDGDNDSQTLGPFTNELSEFQPAAIALASLDDVHGQDMVICERPTYLVHIYRRDGTELPGWPQSTAGLAGGDWNWAAPAIGDIDGDGEEEIVLNTLNGVTWAWNLDGSEVLDGDNNAATHGVFLQRAGAEWEWSMSGPALADLDGDGAKDIIFGTKNDSSGLNRLMALRYDGTDVPGFPYVSVGDIACHPAVGDLDDDGVLEIVFWDSSKRVYAVHQDGTDYPGFPYYAGIGASMGWVTSPALGDVDADGELEIVWTAVETGDRSRVAVIDTDVVGGTSGTMLAGWPVVLPGSSEGSPIIGDITGDGSPDILQGIGGGSEDAPNNLYAFNIDGTAIAGFPITLGGPIMNSVTICDFNYDGFVDIVYGGWDMQAHVWTLPYAYDRLNVPWPTFQGNNKRDGVIFDPTTIGVEDGADLPPANFQVSAPFPNPFNPVTSVRLYVPEGQGGVGELELTVFDLKGRRVKALRTGVIETGWHTITWDGTDDGGRTQASGVYFMSARSGSRSNVHKMTLVK
jgi:Peptidase family C25/FlgD Ig-like domain/FG-GAP-like repeat